MHSEGLPILSYLYFVTITSYYHILVSTLYSIATELFFKFHFLSAMIMCIIIFTKISCICLILNKLFFLLLSSSSIERMINTAFPLWNVSLHPFSNYTPWCQDACKKVLFPSFLFLSPLFLISFNITKCQIN